MHTTDGKTKGITFHHNGDYSGEVLIVISENTVRPQFGGQEIVTFDPRNSTWTVRVPFEDLKMLVADYIRDKRISEVESAEDNVILGLS